MTPQGNPRNTVSPVCDHRCVTDEEVSPMIILIIRVGAIYSQQEEAGTRIFLSFALSLSLGIVRKRLEREVCKKTVPRYIDGAHLCPTNGGYLLSD